MKTVAYFISNHGFGHIMRNIPVIGIPIKRGYNIIIVSGEKQVNIAKGYFQAGVRYLSLETDAGLNIIPGTLKIDTDSTKESILDNIQKWNDYKKVMETINADIVVADIVPWALIAAMEQRIPSILMTSFTWVEQYEWFMPDEIVNQYRDAFKCADKVLYYDLVNEKAKNLLPYGIDVGFVSREFSELEVDIIRARHKNPIVFLSLGASNSGLDFDIDVSDLPYDFVSTGLLRLKGENVYYIDKSVLDTQNYIKAAEYCITKPGWTTTAEIMLAGSRFALLKRPDVPEDTMTIAELEKRNAAISIDVDELRDMKSVMERLAGYPKSNVKYKNNYKYIADIICDAVEKINKG